MARYAVYRAVSKEKNTVSRKTLLSVWGCKLRRSTLTTHCSWIITDLSNKLPEKCRLVFQYNKLQDRIKVPVLVIRGEDDFWSREIDLATFYNELVSSPRRKKLVIPHGSHFLFLDRLHGGRQLLVSALSYFIGSGQQATSGQLSSVLINWSGSL